MKNFKQWVFLIVLALAPFTGAFAACKGVAYDCEQTTDTTESGALRQQPCNLGTDIVDDMESFVDFFSGSGCAGDGCSDNSCANGNCATNSKCAYGCSD